MSEPSQPDWERADDILEAALELPPAARAAFVARATADDPVLRALVERLVRAAVTPDPLLDRTPGAADATLEQPTDGELAPHHDPLLGTRLGAYEVVRELGHGGMAVVYLGRRTDGEFEQEVAIKVLARGFASPEMRQRFRRERQILAASSHEHLARLFDSGETADGRPYFVMERVDGRRIDRYCDEERASVRERVELVVAVAHAVADAHRRLVVHRDIKPSNILITASGRPKLLDFGIAKLLAASDGDETRATARLMTPAYAAPEQVRGEEVTTATDVYQLGLLLYELLTGRLPYDAKGERMTVERRICEQPPARLAQALRAGGEAEATAVATLRGVSVAELERLLRGDLEAVLLKALAKPPEERYVSVTAFLQDLERYLDGRPVRARPPSFGYQLRKFVERHRGPVAAGVLVLVLLVAYAVSMAWQARRLERERDRANREARTAEQVADFLVGLFREIDPARSQQGETSARELLDIGAGRLTAEQIADPELRARLQRVFGHVYRNLAQYEQAEALLAPAVATLEETLGAEAEDTLRARRALIDVVHLSGRLADARNMAEALLAVQLRRFGEDSLEVIGTRSRLGEIAHTEGRLRDAETLFRTTLAARRRAAGSGSTAWTKDRLARVLMDRDALGEAEALTREAREEYLASAGPDHPSTILTAGQLGEIAHRRGELDRAASELAAAHAHLARVIGAEHPTTLLARSREAQVALARGDVEMALSLHLELVDGLRRAAGPESPPTLVEQGYTVLALGAAGKVAEAEALADQTLEALRRTLGDASQYTLAVEARRAIMLDRAGQSEAARAAFASLVERVEGVLGAEHRTTHLVWFGAAACAARLGRDDEALALLERALAAGATRELDESAFTEPRARGALDDLLARLDANRRAAWTVPAANG